MAPAEIKARRVVALRLLYALRAHYPNKHERIRADFLSRPSTHFHRSVIHAGTEFESRMSDLFASLPARIGDFGY
jgi:hypothetical protein